MTAVERPNWPGNNDPMDWLDDLQKALEAPGLEEFERPGPVSEEAKKAAYEVAAALGRCRVFGIEVPEDLEGVLPPAEATAAAEIAAQYVQQWTEDARTLCRRWDEADPIVGQALCCEMLEACMESYFVMEAVSEALEAAWREGETANELFQAVRALGVAIDDFDKALQERDTLALLSTVVELPLLENWRSQLAGVHKECPPWWLDGTLEAVDQEITEICRRTLPAGQTWRRLVAGAAGPTAQPAAPPTRPEIGLPEETEMPRPITRPRRPYRYVAAEIFQIQPFYAAAADTPIKLPPIKTFLQWRSPDGRFQARLEIPSEASPEAMLVMQFLTPQEELASELGGQPVWLGGVEAYIEPAGVARFPLQRLKDQLGKPEAELILQVGPDRTEWPAAEQT